MRSGRGEPRPGGRGAGCRSRRASRRRSPRPSHGIRSSPSCARRSQRIPDDPVDVPADHRHRSAGRPSALSARRGARSSAASTCIFYDAISPIVLAETIDMTKVFRASRWGRSLRVGIRGPDRDRDLGIVRSPALGSGSGRCACRTAPRPVAADDGEGDYLNCPLTEAEYNRFYDALRRRRSPRRSTTSTRRQFFEGCLPIEVMAHRGRDTLRFGPMKPVGLVDPRTGRGPVPPSSCGRTHLPAITSAWSASRRRSEMGRSGACACA